METQFAYPYVLLLAWLAPVLVIWWEWDLRRRERALDIFMSAAMRRKLSPPARKLRIRWQLGLMGAGILLAIIAAARPQWGTREEVVLTRGRDLIIALDVSRSMLAADVHPNRLQRAKIDVLDLIRDLRGDRAGLVAFRNNATVLCPLTTDYAYLREALDGVDIDSARPGETDIGAAITTSLEALDSEEASHQAIVLISDGEDLEGKAIDAAKTAAERGVVIFTVGLGSRAGAAVPPSQQGGASPVVTKLDDSTLDQIASATGGAYIPLGTASTANMTLGTLYRDHLRKISAQDIQETLERKRIDRFQWFLFPAILMFLAAGALSRGRLALSSASGNAKQPVPGTRTTAPRNLSPAPQPLKQLGIAIGLLWLGAQLASATGTNAPPEPAPETEPETARLLPGRAGARAAQSRYRAGDYAKAAEAYLQAANGASGDAERDFLYNAAASFYQAGEYRRAAELLQRLDRNTSRLAISENLGAALYEAAQALDPEAEDTFEQAAVLMKESAEAFREAARQRDGAEDALKNLAIASSAAQQARDNARIQGLLRKYSQSGPDQIMADMLDTQRQVTRGMARSATNTTPTRIDELEALSKQQRAAADLWIPLKGKLLEAAAQSPDADEQQLAELHQMIETTRDNMLRASDALADLDPEAEQAAGISEAAVYGIWKSIAPYEMLLAEDLRLQTNVVLRTSGQPTPQLPHAVPTPAIQQEARALSDLFLERFTAAVPEQAPESAAPPATQQVSPETMGTAPAIDAQTRARILDLTQQAIGRQEAAMAQLRTGTQDAARAEAAESHRLLEEVQALLPKKDNQQQQQNQQQKQQEDQQKEQQQQNEQDSQQNEQKDAAPEQAPRQKEAQAAEPEDSQEDKTPEDVKQLLERALQREREHAEEERRRQHIPMAPSARDW